MEQAGNTVCSVARVVLHFDASTVALISIFPGVCAWFFYSAAGGTVSEFCRMIVPIEPK